METPDPHQHDAEGQPPLGWEPPTIEHLQAMMPQYRFIGEIGVGGMGAVYKAVHITLDRPVAIKVLPPGIDDGETDFAERFQNEARMMAKLTHSGIVNVFDFGQTSENHLFLVMEFISGNTLHDVINKEGRLNSQVALSYTLQLCEALEYAHEHGIIHRDIKPANILINTEGRVKIADFGLARPVAAFEQEVLLGTPDYVAPEIMQDPTKVDQRADIYALGVVIHEMLTGQVLSKPRKPVSAIADVEPGWDDVVAKATRILPKDRYSRVKELQTAVAMISNRRRGSSTKTRKALVAAQEHEQDAPERSLLLPTLMPIVLVLALFFGGVWYWRHNKSQQSVGSQTAPDLLAASRTSSSHAETAVAPYPAKPAAAIAVSPATPTTASASKGPYQIPAVPPGHVFKMQDEHRDPISAVVMFADGYRVATGSWDGTVKVWDLHASKVVRTLGPVEGEVRCVAVSPDGRYIAAGDSNYTVHVWDVESAVEKAKSTQRGRYINSVAFSSTGAQLLSACSEQGASLQLWNWQNSNEGEVLGTWRYAVNALAMMPNTSDSRFVTVGGSYDRSNGGMNSEIWIGNVTTKSPVVTLPSLPSIPSRVAVSADGKRLAIALGLSVLVLDAESGKQIGSIKMDRMADTIWLLDKGRLVLTGHQDKTIRIWETLTGKELYRATAETRCTPNLAVSADEKFVVSGGGYQRSPQVQKDGDFSLHFWALPELSKLVSPESKMAEARLSMEKLDQTDNELAKLQQELKSEWETKVDNANDDAGKEDLEKKYVQALQRSLTRLSPSQRSPFLSEISRVSNKGAVPVSASSTWPPNLQRLFNIFLQQLALLKDTAIKDKLNLAQSQRDKVSQLITAREKSGDELAMLRAKTLLEEVENRINPPPPKPVVSAMPSMISPGGASILPSNMFTINVLPLDLSNGTRLTRPQRAGQVVVWPRDPNLVLPGGLANPPSDLGPVVAIAVGDRHALALKPDGTVASWGHEDVHLQAPPPGLDHVVAIAAGPTVSICLREDGSIVAWSTRNQLAAPPDTKPAVAIYPTYSSTFLRHADGTLTYVFTSPTTTSSIYKVPQGLGSIVDLSVNNEGAFALLQNGSISTWGRTQTTSSKSSNSTRYHTFSTLPLNRLNNGLSIAVNNDNGYFLCRNGELVVWGGEVSNELRHGAFFPGAARLVRGLTFNGIAIQSSTGGWKFINAKPGSNSIDTASAERNANHCADIGIGLTHIVGLKF